MTQGIDLSKDTPELSESLEASSEKSEISWSRRQDAWFVVLAIVCLLLFMALGSYTPGDDGWSSVGSRSSHNSVGVVGATIADLLFHGLGYLAYAFPTLILAKIALMFRRRSANTASIWFLRVFGFVMTLASLCSLAHVSIWSGEELPVGSGGALGLSVFQSLLPLFGFAGAIAILVGVLAIGLMLFLEFSWLLLFERIGGGLLMMMGFVKHKIAQARDAKAEKGPGDAVQNEAPADNHTDVHEQPQDSFDSVVNNKGDDENDIKIDAVDDHLIESVSTPAGGKGLLARLLGKNRKTSESVLDSDGDDAATDERASIAPAHKRTEPAFNIDELDNDFGLLPKPEHRVAAEPAPVHTPASAKAKVPEVPETPAQSTMSTEPLERPVQQVAVNDTQADEDDIPWLTDEEPSAIKPTPSASQAESAPAPVAAASAKSSEQPAAQAPSDPAIPITPLEKRDTGISERAKQDMQGKLFQQKTPLPSIAVLDPPKEGQKSGFSPERLQEMSKLLVQKLADFGVKIEVTAVAPGPVITRFEIQPAAGVKASKITNLAKDLARSMAMISVRVVEVIPGKSVMGIEVPNENRAIVSFSEVLSSNEFDKSKSPLTLALGHDIGGNSIVADLAKMPHLLVAGTTGSGKSVGINAMILSMLFKATPEELRMIMVDPKMLELSVYEGIPHLLTPVITDMKEAANGLRWSVAEMERRYQLMASLGVRNLAGYNKKVKEAIEAGEPIIDPLWDITVSYDTTPRTLEPLPYIVIVIDEFADMMMMVGKKVEELIARIAQKARAAGIHMILATQRPSVDVITGLIKANVPTRIAFQVSSRIDSRTILDQGGAEQLLGHGDMLFMPPGIALPERVHGAFVDDDEVHRVVAEWKLRGEPNYLEEIVQTSEERMAGEGGAASGGDEQDELFDQAVAFVTESGKCSTSSVQRKLRIGYNRAARLVEAMEAAGVVSPPAHNGSREVLAPPPPSA
ncbi:DNA translocase FtsK [Oceanobacter kriegii]|uniref:DNA translocase FtsK n=1 Tax=Oceanobacter kriegii TaxID=64972 RepID=UPI0006888D36|nr:DNA translocase FtsK [Oceanobacter kriegii]